MRFYVKEKIGGYHSTCFSIFDRKIDRVIAITFTRPDATMIVKRLNESGKR